MGNVKPGSFIRNNGFTTYDVLLRKKNRWNLCTLHILNEDETRWSRE